MQTSAQLFLDRHVVRPVIAGLNVLVRLLGKILRMDHSLNRPFRVIAVCKYKGMGSIIQATPLMQTLRRNYPEAKIVFITTRTNVELLNKISCIDETIVLDDSSFFTLLTRLPSFIVRLIASRIDVYLDLEIYSNFSSLVTTLSMARNRIGYYLRSSNYRLGIYTHMMFFNTNVPIAQVYLQLARLLGCREVSAGLYPLASRKDHSFPDLPFDYLNEKYVIVNPNASDLRIERRWAQPNFISLIRKITGSTGYRVVLIGNKKEQVYTESIAAAFSGQPVYSLAGKTSLEELIAVIGHAALVITNDTGPMHLALAAGTKTVSLFGPCSPAQYGLSENNISIYKKVYCSPCVHEFIIPPCKGDNQCMKRIGVDEVFEAVTLALQANTAPVRREQEIIFYSTSGDDTLGKVFR